MLTNIQVTITIQLLGLSRRQCGGSPIDMTVVVELASRTLDLPQNESYDLLPHGLYPALIVNFLPGLHHLSLLKKKARYINSSRQYN